jgi:fatty-acyl-CoA synthase
MIQVGGTVDNSAKAAGVVGYEQLISDCRPAAPIERSSDDLWFLYTGGTTGNPKAVMWPHRSMFAAMHTYYTAAKLPQPSTTDEALAAVRLFHQKGRTQRMLAAAPLMHGTSGISAVHTFTLGGMVDCLGSRHFDADELWSRVQERRITFITIVGDAFCRPMIEALDRAAATNRHYEISSLHQVLSSGVIWSKELKQRLLEYRDCTLIDSLGSSEGLGFGRSVTTRTEAADLETAKFMAGENTIIIADDGRKVTAGSGEIGKLALTGSIPLGYYKDQAKTDETFPEHFGKRWSIPGDYATLEADGTITLLGRGSVSINSGGEKIYPEEVEEAVKSHPDVLDCNAIGVPDERWGQAVVAVTKMIDSASASDDEIIDHVKGVIARYKAPKHLVRVDDFCRSTNGKSDYKWAKATAYQALGLPQSS